MDINQKLTEENNQNFLQKNLKWILPVGIIFGLVFIILSWFGSTYNSLVIAEEPIAKAWGNVETEYQSRADKVQVISKIVKNAANFERQTLTDVIEARSKASSINLDVNDLTPENMAKFEAAQSQLTGALSRLMVTVERYPELKATDAFRDFQAQYEGIENRIAKARRDFNTAIEPYNVKVKRFPTNIVANYFDFEEKTYFESNEGAENVNSDEIDLGFD